MKKYSWRNSSPSLHCQFMFCGYSDIVPVTLLLLLVIGAMGVLAFWALSLLNLSE
ncbi:MAG: hypothetical protein H8K10_08525 [Nitrospira sp.]|nr:hypothetical protein [Nitrospira sp.]